LFAQQFPRFVPLAVATIARMTAAESQVKIARAAPGYRPTAGPEAPEPVSMRRFFFEGEPATGRARVVIDYTYPDQTAFGKDVGAGPEPTMAQFPGRKYDAVGKTVVYQSAGKRIVRATVRGQNSFFRKSAAVKPTDACGVTSRLVEHMAGNGWSIRRFPTVDTFFEVR
jgi:hypothetical protein